MRAFLTIAAVVLFFLLISCGPAEVSPTSTTAGKADGSIQITDVLHLTFPTVGVANNSCNGELVQYQGTLKLTIKTKDQGNGNFSRLIESDIKAKGIGQTTGTAYEVMSTSGGISEFEVGPPFPRVTTNQLIRKLVSKGSEPNAVITFTVSNVWDENGLLVSSSATAATDCR